MPSLQPSPEFRRASRQTVQPPQATSAKQPLRPANIMQSWSPQPPVLPPPSYDEVVSSPESNPYCDRSSKHEYEHIDELETDGNHYKEISVSMSSY